MRRPSAWAAASWPMRAEGAGVLGIGRRTAKERASRRGPEARATFYVGGRTAATLAAAGPHEAANREVNSLPCWPAPPGARGTYPGSRGSGARRGAPCSECAWAGAVARVGTRRPTPAAARRLAAARTGYALAVAGPVPGRMSRYKMHMYTDARAVALSVGPRAEQAERLPPRRRRRRRRRSCPQRGPASSPAPPPWGMPACTIPPAAYPPLHARLHAGSTSTDLPKAAWPRRR